MSPSPKIADLLNNVPLFSGLSNEILLSHVDLSNRINLVAGEILLAPGDENEYIYVILSGRLRINSDKSSDEPIAIFGEGESVSEMSILNGSKSRDYLIADTKCELLCIDPASVWSLLKSSHHAALNMLNILSKPISVTERKRNNYGVDQRKRNNYSLENQHGYSGSNHVDELTGLYSSQWIFKIFERQIRRLSMKQTPAILMLVSIDQLDQYNERHGTLAGDQALRTIAQAILTCLRPEDHSGRYHDAVIAVLLAQTTLEEGRIAGQRLMLHAGQAEVSTPGGEILPRITISIGITEVKLGSSLPQLFDQATEALNRAMEAGGNCVSN